MAGLEIQPILLTFKSKELERAYLADHFVNSLKPMRIAMILGLSLFALFGILDAFLLGENNRALNIIRYGIVCPYMILIFIASYSKNFKYYGQILYSSTIILAGAATIQMALITYPKGGYHHTGLLLIIFFAYTFSRLRLPYAAVSSAAIVILFLINSIISEKFTSETTIVNTAFFLASNLIGFFACHTMEFLDRKDFSQRSLVTQSNKELQQANKFKTELMGIVAHDLKNPLAATLLNAQMVELYGERLSMDEISEYTQKIQWEVNRMLEIVNLLIDINKMESGKYEMKPEEFLIGEFSHEIFDEYEQQASSKSINLNFECKNEEMLVYLDRQAIGQILDNLLSNAIKFSPPEKNVWFIISGTDSTLQILVRDEGPGFSQEDREKMFEKYVQLSAKPTAGEDTSGLGLSIVKMLVDVMKGQIECESTLGSGATFIVHLPILKRVRSISEF
ncbi:MAG: tetratricopeptide repeat protein [Ignavibacteria bacterium]|nr:tetratricopeptide repeat protein [Ignavibacteria bacterium]